MTFAEAFGSASIIFGVIFSVLGVVGVIRLPDTYTRLHATGKTGTLGIAFLCLGAGVLFPPSAPKLIVLGLFIFFSAPVASHAIAMAVYRAEQKSLKNIDTEALPIATSDLPSVSQESAS